MAVIRDIEVVVFDVLGTLVDEPSGLRAGIREAVPASDEAQVDELLALWQRYGEREQQRIGQGNRAYANTSVIHAEAAQLVATRVGFTDPSMAARLATAGQRLPPWGDCLAGLEQLSRHFPVLGLSNAAHTALLRLNTHAGLRWHQALSAETVRAYKPPRRSTNSPSTPPDAHRTASSWWPPTPGTCAEPRRRGCGPPTSTGPSGTRPRAVTPSTGDSTDWANWSPP